MMQFNYLLFLIFLASLIASTWSSAQGIVTGTVYNKNKIPMSNVVVSFKNTTIGTLTDENGTFSLNEKFRHQDTLVVSLIGFETLEMPLDFSFIDSVELSLILRVSRLKWESNAVEYNHEIDGTWRLKRFRTDEKAFKVKKQKEYLFKFKRKSLNSKDGYFLFIDNCNWQKGPNFRFINVHYEKKKDTLILSFGKNKFVLERAD